MGTRLYLYDMGKKLSKLVKTPLNVDFLWTDVWNFRPSRTSLDSKLNVSMFRIHVI